MEQSKRLPTMEGLKKAQELLNKLHKKRPTEELLRIIKEYSEEQEAEPKNRDDRAASKNDSEMGI